MLDIFSFNHFLYVIAIPLVIIGIYYAFKNKTNDFKYWFLFGLTVLAWVIHFSRYWLEPNLHTYQMFFTDLCGISTLVYPFIMLSKKKVFMDYMYYLGAVFAFSSLAYPNNIAGDPIFVFNTIRFFFAHVILVAVPVLLVTWKMHVPNIKNLGWMFLFLMMGGIYNMALSQFFVETGLRNYLVNYMGIWGRGGDVFELFEIIAPWLTYEKEVNGIISEYPIPFIYIIPGAFLVYMPTWVLMSLPFINLKEIMSKIKARIN